MERAIIVERLVKNFEVTERNAGFWEALGSLIKPKKKTVEALKGVSFSVSEGEFIGLIGPNGAGKTTILKILSGILFPTHGFVQVMGYTPWERKESYLKTISMVMGQKNQLWWDLPATDTFELNRRIYDIPDRTYQKNLRELVNLLGVEKYVKRQVRRLSLGQRMRLELVAALIHKPKVVFLDEPTIGLDVIAQKKLRDFIKKYNREHKATIILTSHNMDDVIELCRRVIVINEGEIVFDGDLKDLIARHAKEKVIKFSVSSEIDTKKLAKVGRVGIAKYPYYELYVSRSVSKVAASELLSSFPVSDLTIEEEPINEIVGKVFSSNA